MFGSITTLLFNSVGWRGNKCPFRALWMSCTEIQILIRLCGFSVNAHRVRSAYTYWQTSAHRQLHFYWHMNVYLVIWLWNPLWEVLPKLVETFAKSFYQQRSVINITPVTIETSTWQVDFSIHSLRCLVLIFPFSICLLTKSSAPHFSSNQIYQFISVVTL